MKKKTYVSIIKYNEHFDKKFEKFSKISDHFWVNSTNIHLQIRNKKLHAIEKEEICYYNKIKWAFWWKVREI